MSAVEISEVVKFLQQTVPFQLLNENALRRAIGALDVLYVRNGQTLTVGGDGQIAALHVIRRGAFEIRSAHGHLVDRIADGEYFGVSTVLDNNPEGFVVLAMEDSLVYRIAKDDFLQITRENADFALFFANTRANRLRKLNTSHQQTMTTPALQLSTPLTKLMTTNLVMTQAQTTIQAAAIQMTGARVSSILIVENNKLIGIITDRDLRSRVLTQAMSPSRPVADIMTRNPTCLTKEALSIHAQLLMSERNVHHLPIVDQDMHPVGMLTATDLLRNQQLSPLLMVSEINRQKSVAALVEVCQRLPKLIINLVLTDINPADMGEVLATITDNLTRRLIELAVADIGVAPMAFNFIVFGSQARKDQSLGSDQDNGLMLERPPTAIEADYFQRLAYFVCDGLNACGIPHCPGNIMATNPKWVMTRLQWQQKFAEWVDSTSPQALLNASIFFDIRNVYGKETSVTALTTFLQQKAAKNTLFLATLTRNAINAKPPIGFFRNFLLEHSGEHKNQLDLKHQGLALINDLARIYSFLTSTYHSTTLERLKWVAAESILDHDYVKNLEDAWEYLSELRLDTQQQSWQSQGKASAYLNPSLLSPLERKHLKYTFRMINEAQDVTQNKFAKGLG